jgi:hypothetical protein
VGNRAVITTAPYSDDNVGIYVHWNGGRDSVEAFILAAEKMGFRTPDSDCYGIARLVQLIANFFGTDGLSVGVDVCSRLDTNNGDNGTYLIGPGWKITGRLHHRGREQAEYDVEELADKIVARTKAIDGLEPA